MLSIFVERGTYIAYHKEFLISDTRYATHDTRYAIRDTRYINFSCLSSGKS